MADTLKIFGVDYTGVTGIKADDGNGNTLTFVQQNNQSKTKSYTPTTSQQTETITPDNGYTGLSSVAVTVSAMPSGTAGTPSATKGTVSNHSISVTPKVTNTTGYITGSTKTGTAVTVSASELVSGNLAITSNTQNTDVTNYATVSVSVTPNLQSKSKTYTPSSSQQTETITADNGYDGLSSVAITVNAATGTSKNAQAHESTSRTTSTSYSSLNSMTCTKAGTYTVYWSTMRSSTSGTWGSQLYVNGTAYGTADTANWSNHVQNKTLTGVTIGANQTVAVYARSRGSNYYAYVPLVTIIEE